ncbi:MAG: single-stranded-DNA-specific exonuclease RecJ, partial [Bauldia sp.]|nr:single-stranded-DNA-specific exonuclease RecJ [Bauldia sp.]
GGHAMAAGLTVERSWLGDLRGFLASEAVSPSGEDTTASLAIDAALAATGATVDLIERVEQAGPFGAGHAEPVFAFPMHRVGYVETIGNGHVRAALKSPDGTSLKAMAFRAADTDLGRALLDARGRALHVAGTLSADRWQGRTQPSLRIIDAAPA